MWSAIRWPVGGIFLCGVLIGGSFVLDLGGTGARDAALFIGATTLFLLLPASVIWLLVAVVVQVIERRRTAADVTSEKAQ